MEAWMKEGYKVFNVHLDDTERGTRREKREAERRGAGLSREQISRVSFWTRSNEREATSRAQFPLSKCRGRFSTGRDRERGRGKRSNEDDATNKATVPGVGEEGDWSGVCNVRRTGLMAVNAHAGSRQLRRAKFSVAPDCFAACR